MTTESAPPRMRIVRHPLKYRLLEVTKVDRVTPARSG